MNLKSSSKLQASQMRLNPLILDFLKAYRSSMKQQSLLELRHTDVLHTLVWSQSYQPSHMMTAH